MIMKRSWTKYIIGYFFIIAFLFNGIVPEVMILSGQLSHKIVSEALAEQEDVNSERNTEETQGEQRTEYLPVAHTSYYIHPAPNFFVSDKVIPRDIAFISTVVIPVPTPPPDITII
jgi:hypothetical protein